MNLEIDFQNNYLESHATKDVAKFEKSLLVLSESLRQFIFNELSFARDLVSIELSVEICSDEKMKELNQQYRGIDKTTDVLSFELHQDLRLSEPLKIESLCLGDIMISASKAASQAEDFNISLFDELVHLFIHGVVHLMGFDHEISDEEEEIMKAQEEKLLSIFSSLYTKTSGH